MAAAFAPASYDEWRKLVDAALKGASFDQRLVSRTRDGIRIEPVYEGKRDATYQPEALRAGPWTVVQRIEHPDIGEANALVKGDVDGGARGLDLVFAASPFSRGAGLAVETVDDLDQLLAGVDFSKLLIRLDTAHESRHVAALFPPLFERRGADREDFRLQIQLDPLGDLAYRGVLISELDAVLRRVADASIGLREAGISALTVMPDGRIWHAAGASEAQELAFVLATAIAFLRGLEDAGIHPAGAAAMIGFTLAADADQFLTIVKFRALRRIWSRVLQVAEVPERPVHLHAETAWRMMAAHDPHVNLLRCTMAAFAAGVAGADSVTVLPFTAALGVPDAFARRTARNIQTILIEESNLHRVEDPSAGSGALESLTDELVRTAWALFRRIEANGGMLEGLRSGQVQDMVDEQRAARTADVCCLREPSIGTSVFANLDERPIEVLQVEQAEVRASNLHLNLPEAGDGRNFRALVEAARSGVSVTDMAAARRRNPLRIDSIVTLMRLSEPFEALRNASDDELRRRGTRPYIFLAKLGTRSDYGARAAWIKDVFASGGIVSHDEHAFATPQDAADAFKLTGAKLVCLCSSDEKYSDQAMETAELLKAAGAKAILLAGNPGENRKAYEAAGIGLFAYRGCNVVELMTAALAAIGMKPAARGGDGASGTPQK